MTLTDTGPIVALLDREDPYHAVATSAGRTVSTPLVTTEACLTESAYLLYRSSGLRGLNLLRDAVLDGAITVLTGKDGLHARVFSYIDRYSDQPCDYADATLLVAAEETGQSRIFTLDKHFRVYRLTSGDVLAVIP